MRYASSILCCCLAALLLRCSSMAPLAGGSGSVTTNGIVASIAYPDGDPVANARVHLRPADYQLDKHPANSAGTIRDLFTDDEGLVFIDSMDAGTYEIEVNDGEGWALAVRCVVDSQVVDIGRRTVQPYASISGITPVSYAGGSVLIGGLERNAPIGADSRYFFGDLPAGSFSLLILDPDTASMFAESIQAVAGDTVVVQNTGVWKYSRKIFLNTADPSLAISEQLRFFPVLVTLNSAIFDFSQANGQGADLRFMDQYRSDLPLEIETWDSTAAQAEIWVLVPRIEPNTDTGFITMVWGNRSAKPVSDGASVFDSRHGFVAVYHFNNSLNNSVLLGEDAIAVRVSPADTQGVIGGGIHVPSVDSGFLRIPGGTGTGLDMTTDVTVSAWLNVRSAGAFQGFVSRENSLTLKCNGGSVSFGGYCHQPDTTPLFTSAATGDSLLLNTWTFFAGTIGSSIIGAWQDSTYGWAWDAPFDSTIAYPNGDWMINAYLWQGGNPDAVYDEVRIENVARSDAWIKLCYVNQKDPGRFLRFE